ncbi:hypothetical protein M1N23_00825 [Dehalococcoidia bacterium]|nr:hypothetical protein [Dehalococcoidia bacterium]
MHDALLSSVEEIQSEIECTIDIGWMALLNLRERSGINTRTEAAISLRNNYTTKAF